MGRVRGFAEADVPAVAQLRRRLFRVSRRTAPGAMEEYMHRVFFLNPWRHLGLESLVLETEKGVEGFIGIVPRPMQLGRATLRVAVSTQFMLAPERRSLGVPQMVRALFTGPQDLTVADAGPEGPRRIWCGLGGDTAFPYSMMWEHSLRPARAALARLGERTWARALRGGLRPVAALADRLGAGPAAPPADAATAAASASELAAIANPIMHAAALAPTYSGGELHWLFAQLSEGAQRGNVVVRVVRRSGTAVGWYVFRYRPGGDGFVFQVGAEPDHATAVLRTLLREAHQAGVVTLRGAADPARLANYAELGIRVTRSGPWVLVQSRRPEVLRALHRGEAWLTGLDGERWLSF